MATWISREAFCEKYEINRNTLDVCVHTGVIPDKHITRKLINEEYILKIQNFKRKMQLKNQELYYLLMEYFNAVEIAKQCSIKDITLDSMSDYLRDGLFRLDDSTLLNTRVSKRAIYAYRYWWKIERRLRRRGASISKILDMRMEKYV